MTSWTNMKHFTHTPRYHFPIKKILPLWCLDLYFYNSDHYFCQKTNRILQHKWEKTRRMEYSLMGFPLKGKSLIKYTNSQLRSIIVLLLKKKRKHVFWWQVISQIQIKAEFRVPFRVESPVKIYVFIFMESTDWTAFPFWWEQTFAKMFCSCFLLIWCWHIYFPGRFFTIDTNFEIKIKTV